jgi:hypothetical protein
MVCIHDYLMSTCQVGTLEINNKTNPLLCGGNYYGLGFSSLAFVRDP